MAAASNREWGPLGEWLMEWPRGWNRFWFTPSAPHTLAAIRVLGGAMLLYTHLVWSLDLMAFVGPNAWIPNDVAREFQGQYTWSHLWYIQSPALLWIVHIVALVVMAMLMVGWRTRIASVLAWLFAVAYCHRLSGSLYGLDQVNVMLAMYLMIGRSGDVWSVDDWLARRRAAPATGRAATGKAAAGRAATGRAGGAKKGKESAGRDRARREGPLPSVATNIAIRLIQLHLSVIYLFGGIGKMRGELWWDGFATWFAVANLEYQSLDMTWLGRFPVLLALLTHVTVFWETFYIALVWHRMTRPIVLALAVMVHGGIALFLGMITFGLAMIIANLAFVPPELVRSFVTAIQQRLFKNRS